MPRVVEGARTGSTPPVLHLSPIVLGGGSQSLPCAERRRRQTWRLRLRTK